MQRLIYGHSFPLAVILSEAKDLTLGLASHMMPCLISASIVRFLSRDCGIGMTAQHARAKNFGPATNQ
jgi:hypothetical protein